MKYITVDLGSTFIKSAILDIEGLTITRHPSFPMPQRLEDTGRRFEVSAEQIYSITKQIIDRSIEQYGEEIGGILFSTQMHGFVLADNRGKPLTPYVSWQDERCLEEVPGRAGVSYLQHLETLISRDEMEETGVYLKAPLALCNLYTMIQQGLPPTDSGKTHFCTLGSYLIFRLTGQNVSHLTNAAPTGLANVVQVEWEQSLIRKIGCEAFEFPKLRDSLDIAGFYSYQGLDIPVYPDVGDQQAAILGTLAKPGTDVSINIGTAAQISMIQQDFRSGHYEIRPFFDGQYLYTISRMPGGRNLDVLIQFIQGIGASVFGVQVDKNEIWTSLQGIIGDSSKGLRVNTSFFKTMEADAGAISQITNENFEIATLFAAAYEDIAATYDKYISVICEDRGALERIVFSGGVSGKNPKLLEVIKRTTGLEGALPPLQDEVFLGLFRLALVCAGVCGTLAETDTFLKNKSMPVVREQ
ncbi:sedoheptulokinase [Ammoniphilus resinae]|uniref:Sugar (Pentulose or hexulose) kinase n=1 Tax=Ammoniphilus resinae TaxID=861532 RepID=A0ABS4GPF8_9BACL|nr:FGGY family carbohydrate kinase [Ammoniphilus resinae]MBP1932159.1 sugar (pentulose or hexulose) kinase [Ammoniphilus resinae]